MLILAATPEFDPHLLSFAAIGGIALLLLLLVAGWCWLQSLRNARRRELLKAPFPESWQQLLSENFPLYEMLPLELRSRLQGLINIFVEEKLFEGCAGLQITDEIRVLISAQACLLLVGREQNTFKGFSTIFVYPSSYRAEDIGEGGAVSSGVRLGESWKRGPLVLSWDDARQGARNIRDGQNVVMHEFAHKLDEEDGEIDGAPALESHDRYSAWAQVVLPEYEALLKRSRRHKRSVIDRYGATNLPEFFAELTVAFFEKPRQLRKKHPELYQEAMEYYHLNPAQWG